MSAQPKVAIKPSLTLKRRLNAPPEKVYAAWTDPEKIVKWFGPDAGPVKSAVLDVRNGGRYAIVFSTEDGEEHHVSGVYREVIPDEKLNFTWAWRTMPERESLVTILIKPDGESIASCAPGHTLPLTDWTALTRLNVELGLNIDARTAATRWRGERMDFGLAIDSLLRKTHKAREAAQRED